MYYIYFFRLLENNIVLGEKEFVIVELSSNVNLRFFIQSSKQCSFPRKLVNVLPSKNDFILPVLSIFDNDDEDESKINLLPFCSYKKVDKYSSTCIFVDIDRYINNYLHISKALYKYIIFMNENGLILYSTDYIKDMFNIQISVFLNKTTLSFLQNEIGNFYSFLRCIFYL